MKFSYIELDSPVGRLKLVADEKHLVAILWENEKPNRVRLEEMELNPKHPVLKETSKQLKEYFAGKRKVFDLPLNPRGSDFQKSVWMALREIPFGETRTYGELAQGLGNPKASRAVGAANGKNPLSIVVPCHRVIGANGTLTGFAGGLEAKGILLKIEEILLF
jgi:methylated-DNA-[protein]-cysteine S-methyltransferase